MNLEKKFEALLTAVVGDPDLKELLEDLIDSNVLSVVYPPVRIKLVCGDSLKIKITDGINSYVMHPDDIDDNMLQDIAKAFAKYKPDESDSEDESLSDTESEKVKREFQKGFSFRPRRD